MAHGESRWGGAGVNDWLVSIVSRVQLFRLAAIAIGGKYFWLLAVLPLSWVSANWALKEWGIRNFAPHDVQGGLIGAPLAFLGVLLGLRIIAGEIRSRNLEIIYTVPGGCEKVWWIKMLAAFLILVAAQILMALAVWIAITPYPILSLYSALQAGVFYMLLAMGFSTLFRSEVGGAIATLAVLSLNGMSTGFGSRQFRISPFFNPYALQQDPETVIAWTVQNRIGFLLFMAAIIALTFMRTARRERMLEG